MTSRRGVSPLVLRIATALSVTIADLLALPTVQIASDQIEIPASLAEFRERMEQIGTYHETLQHLVGEQEATRIMAETLEAL